MAEPLLTQVIVRDMRIDAHIGVYGHEIGQSQPLTVHVVLDVAPVADDRLGSTIDYTIVAAHARDLGKAHVALVETFAHRLAAFCLDLAGVEAADVTVEKPGAIAGGMAGARIVLRRP